ncbi:phosphatase [Escherichia coli]|uniref:Phosphatase n=1 Tax=Escherichia coli TaxID=562 RepID=A0A377CVU4_ECOLX|nr:phosphatase [Escherichia coli]
MTYGPDNANRLPPAKPICPRLVLAHNPDSKEVMRDEPWDLMLCGHTHGGQLRVPLVGEPFAPVEDKRYGRRIKCLWRKTHLHNPWRGQFVWFASELPPGSNDAGTGVDREFYHQNKAGNFLIFTP